MSKLTLDLAVVLPPHAGDTDPCRSRLVDALSSRRGIAEAHLTGEAPGPVSLCVHFDPEQINPSEVEAIAREAGAELARRYEHLAVDVDGLRHERHARLVEAVLRREPGALHVAVALGAKRVFVEYDRTLTAEPALLAALGRTGVQRRAGSAETPTAAESAVGHQGHDHAQAGAQPHDHEHAHGSALGGKAELLSSAACGLFTLAGWLVSHFAGQGVVSYALFGAAYLFGGWFMIREVWLSIRARRFEIDFLMLVAAAGAAALGEWFEGALLLFLFSLGHALEGFAMARARRAIESLAALMPRTATVRDEDGREREIDISELRTGMRVVVKPNSRFPADGVVESGTSSVDQAPITGESVPVAKRPAPDVDAAIAGFARAPREHVVFAGSINGTAALVVVAARSAQDSTLAKVVELVSRAEASKSPTQRFTDRFERVFVPILLGAVGLLLFAWVVVDEPFSASFYRAMSVLVAASPCALAIATPSAVLAGVARAARRGILVKGGAHLESLGELDTIAFDKTGTLTEGRPQLTDVEPASGVDAAVLRRAAIAVESRSDHPIARAVVAAATSVEREQIAAAQDVQSVVGHGVRAVLDGREIRIGKLALWASSGFTVPDDVRRNAERLQATGRTVMIVEHGGRFLGVLGVMDAPRASAANVIRELTALGITRTLMLSGDNQRVADEVAAKVGIGEARADLLPQDKVNIIEELVRSGAKVAMIGDGVNDAPALARATVGIAMGAGGSDVALETADVALMGDDLTALPFAVGLGRACRSVIKQNLWASLGMVAVLVPTSVFGITGIGAAVALHEGSTLLVVANALRLLAYRQR